MIAEIKSINDGLVPICCNCDKIRHPRQDPFCRSSWFSSAPYKNELESDKLTHGICPDCLEKLYPEEYQALNGEGFNYSLN